MLFRLMIFMLFMVANSDNQCVNGTDSYDSENVYIDITYKWVNDTSTIQYDTISKDIQLLITQTTHTITDKSSNKDTLYRIENEVDILNIDYKIKICSSNTDMSQNFKSYVNNGSLALDIKQSINKNAYLNHTIMVESVTVKIKSKDKPWKGWIVPIGLSPVMCLFFLCCILTIYDEQKKKKRKERMKKRKLGSDEKWIEEGDEKSCDNPFIDGVYKGHFTQYNDSSFINKKYKMKEINLRFLRGSVYGNGTDCIGEYSISGIYSDKSKRVALKKKYTVRTIKAVRRSRGTFDHQIRLELVDHTSLSLNGKYYVKSVETGKWSMKKEEEEQTSQKKKAIAQKKEEELTLDGHNDFNE
eukprot:318446_1